MRASQLHQPTLREPPKDAEVISHQYLVRGGYIRRVAAGIYSFLPLGVRSLEKVKTIVRQEMNRAGAQEVFMPAIVPAELWQESGRWDFYGPELLRIKDRKQADFCVGPTHEEVVVDMARKDLRSYKQLPVNFYQIQTKFRDEMRPRAGLMRGRECIMKDAYSFDASVEGAHKSYKVMYDAYQRIFTRLGLDFRAVEADTGNIGGSMSHEFQVLAESGEDNIVSCDTCDFAANVEKAPLPVKDFPDLAAFGSSPEPSLEHTPGAKSIENVSRFFQLQPRDVIKAVLYNADDQPAVAFVRGDHEVNEVKVKEALGVKSLQFADAKWFKERTGLHPGYVGPYMLENINLASPRGSAPRSVLDWDIRSMQTAVTGSNQHAEHHYRGVVPARDLADAQYADLRMAIAADPCPKCAGKLRAFKGIEVGHVFYLGQKYSKSMNATFLAQDGTEKPFEMGCYGIGVSRILSAAIEQNNDARGIQWPVSIAPFEVAVLAVDPSDLAEKLYTDLLAAGIDVVLDDREERPGVKFNDADLIGYPLQIIVGRKAAEGIVEVKIRKSGERLEMSTADLVAKVVKAIVDARMGTAIQLGAA